MLAVRRSLAQRDLEWKKWLARQLVESVADIEFTLATGFSFLASMKAQSSISARTFLPKSRRTHATESPYKGASVQMQKSLHANLRD